MERQKLKMNRKNLKITRFEQNGWPWTPEELGKTKQEKMQTLMWFYFMGYKKDSIKQMKQIIKGEFK